MIRATPRGRRQRAPHAPAGGASAVAGPAAREPRPRATVERARPAVACSRVVCIVTLSAK